MPSCKRPARSLSISPPSGNRSARSFRTWKRVTRKLRNASPTVWKRGCRCFCVKWKCRARSCVTFRAVRTTRRRGPPLVIMSPAESRRAAHPQSPERCRRLPLPATRASNGSVPRCRVSKKAASKSETRNPKSETNAKHQTRKSKRRPLTPTPLPRRGGEGQG